MIKQKGNFNEIIQVYERFILLDPSYYFAYHQKGFHIIIFCSYYFKVIQTK